RPGFPSPATRKSSVETRSRPRRRSRTSGGPLALGGAGLAFVARGGLSTGLGLSFRGALRRLLVGLDAFRQLRNLFLFGLDYPRRHRDGRKHRLLEVVEVRDAFARRQIRETKRVADRQFAHVELEPIGNLHR